MKYFLSFFIISLLVITCSEPNNNIVEPPTTIKNYFFNKNITYWKMKNNNGDTAYFQALEFYEDLS